ncbi:hypothetical protein [Pseudidiomarina sp.]
MYSKMASQWRIQRTCIKFLRNVLSESLKLTSKLRICKIAKLVPSTIS